MRIAWWIIVLTMVPAVAAASDIYQCTASDGSKTFQATPCPDDAKEDRKQLQSNASASRGAHGASASTNDDADSRASRCRSGVLKDFEEAPREIDAYYVKRTRQCRENFKNGSPQIKNCFAEQKQIRAKKRKELEKQKKQSLANCGK